MMEGLRCIAYKQGSRIRLRDGTGNDLTALFPEISSGVSNLSHNDLILDGTLVAFEGFLSSKAALGQRVDGLPGPKVCFYYVHDLLYINNFRITGLELEERRQLLLDLVALKDPLRLTPSRTGAGKAFFSKARERGWAGVVAKKLDSRYRSGRSRNWVNIPCLENGAFLVGGYTASDRKTAREHGIDSLHIGIHRKGTTVKVGEVSQGFRRAERSRLLGILKKLELDTTPFESVDAAPKDHLPAHKIATEEDGAIRWVRPLVKVSVDFSGWENGRIRCPRFRSLIRAPGLRD
jgi:bifunctional non-homologous end joining protein LigD